MRTAAGAAVCFGPVPGSWFLAPGQLGCGRSQRCAESVHSWGLVENGPAWGNTLLFAPRGRKGFSRGHKPAVMPSAEPGLIVSTFIHVDTDGIFI